MAAEMTGSVTADLPGARRRLAPVKPHSTGPAATNARRAVDAGRRPGDDRGVRTPTPGRHPMYPSLLIGLALAVGAPGAKDKTPSGSSIDGSWTVETSLVG